MALFVFNKKEDGCKVQAEPACTCNGNVPAYEAESLCCCERSDKTNTCCGKGVEGICCIKVLGSGCKSCHELYENVKKAVKELELSIEVEYITDMEKVIEYGVMSMPAIVVNDKVVSMGKVLKTVEVIKLLGALGY